jgi:hypothetical protein
MAKNKLSDYSYFSEIVEYINKLEVGVLILRKDLVNYFPSPSLDVYRRSLTLLGVLEDVIRGEYRKIHDIPPFINTTNILEYTKDGVLKNKLKRYYLVEERKKKLKEIFDY